MGLEQKEPVVDLKKGLVVPDEELDEGMDEIKKALEGIDVK